SLLAVRFRAAFLLESLEQLGYRHPRAAGLRLGTYHGIIPGRQIRKTVERPIGASPREVVQRPLADRRDERIKQSPALLPGRVVEADLPDKAAKRRCVEAFHQVGRANEDAPEALRLREELVDL